MSDESFGSPPSADPWSEPASADGGWWQRVYAGRHVTLTAGALEEPGALPVPSWGTFAGIAHGGLTALLCFVAAFPAAQDARHGFVALMVTAVVAGLAEVVAALRLRRGALGVLVLLLGAAAWSLVGDVAVTGKHELHRGLVTAALAALAAVTLVGAIPEWRNANRARTAADVDAEVEAEAEPEDEAVAEEVPPPSE